MTVATFITLVVYVLGVYVAYFQIQEWTKHEAVSEYDYQTLFLLSLFSWLIYPIFGLVWLFKKIQEE